MIQPVGSEGFLLLIGIGAVGIFVPMLIGHWLEMRRLSKMAKPE